MCNKSKLLAQTLFFVFSIACLNATGQIQNINDVGANERTAYVNRFCLPSKGVEITNALNQLNDKEFYRLKKLETLGLLPVSIHPLNRIAVAKRLSQFQPAKFGGNRNKILRYLKWFRKLDYKGDYLKTEQDIFKLLQQRNSLVGMANKLRGVAKIEFNENIHAEFFQRCIDGLQPAEQKILFQTINKVCNYNLIAVNSASLLITQSMTLEERIYILENAAGFDTQKYTILLQSNLALLMNKFQIDGYGRIKVLNAIGFYGWDSVKYSLASVTNKEDLYRLLGIEEIQVAQLLAYTDMPGSPPVSTTPAKLEPFSSAGNISKSDKPTRSGSYGYRCGYLDRQNNVSANPYMQLNYSDYYYGYQMGNKNSRRGGSKISQQQISQLENELKTNFIAFKNIAGGYTNTAVNNIDDAYIQAQNAAASLIKDQASQVQALTQAAQHFSGQATQGLSPAFDFLKGLNPDQIAAKIGGLANSGVLNNARGVVNSIDFGGVFSVFSNLGQSVADLVGSVDWDQIGAALNDAATVISDNLSDIDLGDLADIANDL